MGGSADCSSVRTCPSVKGRAESFRSLPASVGINTRSESRRLPDLSRKDPKRSSVGNQLQFSVNEADLIKEIPEHRNFIILCSQN